MALASWPCWRWQTYCGHTECQIHHELHNQNTEHRSGGGYAIEIERVERLTCARDTAGQPDLIIIMLTCDWLADIVPKNKMCVSYNYNLFHWVDSDWACPWGSFYLFCICGACPTISRWGRLTPGLVDLWAARKTESKGDVGTCWGNTMGSLVSPLNITDGQSRKYINNTIYRDLRTETLHTHERTRGANLLLSVVINFTLWEYCGSSI